MLFQVVSVVEREASPVSAPLFMVASEGRELCEQIGRMTWLGGADEQYAAGDRRDWSE